jgi:hypothetical protein
MARIIGSCVFLAIVIIFAYPFARDAYHRYEVGRRLDPLMDDRDRAAFRAWNGDAASFGRSLYDRCVLTNGQGSPKCEAYMAAIR